MPNEMNVCEMMDRHQKAVNLIQNNDHKELIRQAYANSGEMSTITNIDFGETRIRFEQNGTIVLTFEDVTIDSVFENQPHNDNLDSISIVIDNDDVIPQW